MNVFYLDKDPKKCASYHCDEHCVKMIIEYAQIMSTVHRVLDGEEGYKITKNNRKVKNWVLKDDREKVFYKASFYHHPCVLWCEKTSSNYKYLYELFCALCDEFKKRYGKTHLTDTKLRTVLKTIPSNIPHGKFTEPAKAMPEDCRLDTALDSYRNYYNVYKSEFATWKNVNPPKWFKPVK